MGVDKVDGATDDETEQAVEHQPLDRRPPPDRPGAEGLPSRADSRRGALVANEKPTSVETVASAPSEEIREDEEPKDPDSGEVPAADGVIDQESAESEEPEGGKAPRPYAERLDVPIDDGEPTPREVLERFDPADANLPEVTEEEAAEYIAQNADRRPWLVPAKDCEPCVQWVLVAMDQGQGHALERHEGYADDEKLQRRVTALEDPAQLDPAKRIAGIDGCKPGDREHLCGNTATAIQSPYAFATVFARGIEHHDVQSALQTPFDRDVRPSKVSVPIEDLLGADGYQYCSGYRLEPVNGSLRAAQDCRAAWVTAQPDPYREPDVPPPRFNTVERFEGASVKFFFGPNHAEDGYEIATMYVEPNDAI
jgi:hypothetical protein